MSTPKHESQPGDFAPASTKTSDLVNQVVANGNRVLAGLGLVSDTLVEASSTKLVYELKTPVRETSVQFRNLFGKPKLYQDPMNAKRQVREFRVEAHGVIRVINDTSIRRSQRGSAVEFIKF